MESAEHIRTGIAAALFAAVFLFGAPMHPVRRLIHDRRSLVSLGAVIVNSAVMELTNETHGRLLPFLFGGVLYGLILLPLG